MSGDGFTPDDGFREETPPRPPTGRESVMGEEAPGFGRGVARGGWALPGLLGLDYETAVGAEFAIRDPQNLADRGMGFRDRFAFYRDAERERSRRGEEENPIRTGLGIGVGSAPSVAIIPQAKAAEGASLGARAATSAFNTGAQSALVEGGVTGGLPPEERAKRVGIAAVAGAGLGALAPVPSHVPTQTQIDAAAGVPAVPGSVRSWLKKKAEEEAFKSAAAGNAKSEMARVNRENPARANEVGRFLLDENLIGSNTAQPDDIFRAAQALAAREAEGLDAAAAQASHVAERVPSASVDLADVVRGPGRAAIRELADDPFQPAAAEQVTGHIKRLANKYANREALIADFQKAVGESGLDDDVAESLMDDLTLAAKTYLPGIDDVGPKAAKAGRVAAREGELSKPEAALVQAYLASVAEKYQSARITPAEAWTVRKQLDTLIRGNSKALDPDRNVASGAMNDFRRDLSTRLGTAMDEAKVGSAWREGNRRFGLAADARDVAEVGRSSVANRGFGLSEQLGTGFGGAIGGAAAGWAGGPVGMVAGGLAGHAVRKYGSATAARTLDRLSKALQANPKAFGEYAGKLTIAAERGPEALAAAHYVLSHSSADYRARAAQVLEQPDSEQVAAAPQEEGR